MFHAFDFYVTDSDTILFVISKLYHSNTNGQCVLKTNVKLKTQSSREGYEGVTPCPPPAVYIFRRQIPHIRDLVGKSLIHDLLSDFVYLLISLFMYVQCMYVFCFVIHLSVYWYLYLCLLLFIHAFIHSLMYSFTCLHMKLNNSSNNFSPTYP